MTEKYYTINKGINKPIEFRGLKAQYIGLLAASVLGSLVVFGMMHIAGVNDYVCVPLTLGLGGFLWMRVFRMSRLYGQYGLMKRRARRATPKALLSRGRKFFIHLFSDYAGAR